MSQALCFPVLIGCVFRINWLRFPMCALCAVISTEKAHHKLATAANGAYPKAYALLWRKTAQIFFHYLSMRKKYTLHSLIALLFSWLKQDTKVCSLIRKPKMFSSTFSFTHTLKLSSIGHGIVLRALFP